MDAGDRDKHLLQLHHQLSCSGHQIDVSNLFQLLELEQLRQGDEFACYLKDEKVPRLMCVEFHPGKSQLYLKPVPPSNSSAMNNNFNNSTDHNCHGGFSLDLTSAQMVVMGRTVKEEAKIRNILQITQPIRENHCLSIYYGNWPWKELQLVARDPAVVGVWHLWLERFIMHQRNTQNTAMSKLDQWLLVKYTELKTQQKGAVHAVFAVRSFTGFRLWKASKILNSLLKSDKELSSLVEQYLWELPFSIYQALYYSYIITERPDIQHLYSQNARSSLDVSPTIITDQSNSPKLSSLRRRSSLKILNLRSRAEQRRNTIYSCNITSLTDMSIDAFANFLSSFQGLNSLSTEEVKKIILDYDFQTVNDQDVSYISLKGFAHYLLSQEPSPFSPLQDMTQPLSNYYIASSHNTYLTGHQLHGESSTSMYATVLQTGCRCVELDCWDGEEGEPIIYHGHTLTTKIKFEHVVQTIAKHAFMASPYPLVLSIENHCSIPQQVKMTAYMKREFGNLLLTDFIDDNHMPERLPSPEDLKYKILVKNRKLSNSVPLATQQSQPSSVVTNRLPQSPLVSKSFFNSSDSSPKSTTPPSTSPITPTSATSCPASANIFGFSFPNGGTTEPQYISSEKIRQKPTLPHQNATGEETDTWQHSPLQQCCSLPSSPTLRYQPMSIIFENENDNCDSLGRSVYPLQPTTRKHSHNLHRTYSASQFEFKTNQKSLLFDEQGDQLSSAKGGHSISLDTVGTEAISQKLQADDNDKDMNKELLLPKLFSNSRTGGVYTDGLQIETNREEDEQEEQLPKLRGRRGGVIKETYQLQNDDTEEQDDEVLNNPRDTSNLEESPHHIIYTENVRESSQNQCRPTSILIVSSDECDLASSLPESLLVSALKEMDQQKSNSNKTTVSPTPSFSKHSKDLSIDSSSYSPPSSPHIVWQIRSTAGNDSILPIHTSPSFNLGNPKSEGQFEQPSLQKDRPNVFKRLEPADNGRCFEDNDISQSLFSLLLSSPIESSQDSLSFANVTKPVHSLSNRGDMKQVSPLPRRKDIFNPSQSSVSLTSNSSLFTKKKNGNNGKSLKKLNSGSSLKMLGHNLHRSNLALSRSSDPLPSGQYIDTMEASYSKNDIAQELSDLVVYTEAKKFPGFKDPKKVALKCTEMYSVAEPTAKKTVKKTPTELLEFTDNNLMRIYPSPTRFNSSNFNPASFWMHGCQMVALNYQTNDQWMQYYSTFFQQNSGLGYVLKPSNLREQHDSSDTKQSLTTELKIMTISTQHYLQSPTFLPTLEMEILGVPRDCCKLKTQCNTVTGNCGLWDPEKDNIFVVNLTHPSFAAVKFTLIVEKDSPALVKVVLTNDLQVGYQHVYFTENSLLSGHHPSSIFINVQKNVVGDSTKDSYWSRRDSQLANDFNSDSSSSQLVIVPIYYNDLPNVDHDPVSLFADPTTTSNELLIGALAQLDSSINEACSQLQDREDEHELLKYFQFTLAQKKKTGEIRKICSLDHGRLIMPLFEWNSKKHCLLVTLKSNQEDNSVVIETATCDTNPITIHQQSSGTGSSELVRRPSTVTLAETSLSKKSYLDVAELSLNSLSSATSKQRRISVDMKIEVNAKQQQKASLKTVISRSTPSSHPLATVIYRKKNDSRHVYQRAFSVDYIQYKRRQQSSRQHQIEIGSTEDSSQSPQSAIRKKSERSKLKQSVTFAAFPEIQQPTSGRIKLTKKFRKLFSQKQRQMSSSQEEDDVFSGEDNDDDYVTDYSDSSCSISGDNFDNVDPPILNPVTKPSSLFRKKTRRHSAPVKRTDSYKHPRKKNSTGINIKR